MAQGDTHQGNVTKEPFPGLLLQLHNSLKAENLIAGFKGTGIHPVNWLEVLKRLPTANHDVAGTSTDFNDSVMDILQKHCAPSKTTASRPRGKKITPGKCITPEDLGEGTSTTTTSVAAKKSVACRSTGKSNNDDVESESDESDDGTSSSSSDSEADSDTSDHTGTGNDKETEYQMSFSPTQWVVVKYSTKRSVMYFLGQVLMVSK